MKIVRNSILPVGRGFDAINIFGVLFAKRDARITPQLINHERIHTSQMRELMFVFFYIIYLCEWILRLFQNKGDFMGAYMAISFEREACAHAGDLSYISGRKCFAQWRRH